MFEFIFELFAFLFFLVSAVYLPGRFLLNKLKLELKPLEDLFVPTGVGLAIFTLVSYIFSWLQIAFLLVFFFLVIDFLAIKSKKWLPKKPQKMHIKPLLVVGTLSVIFSLSMLITGKFGDTIIFRHDDVWHLALINELKNNFPPDNPGVSEIPLRGYHFFYNLLLAKVSNSYFISGMALHFHFFPALFSLLLGLGVYVLMFRWSNKIAVPLWAVFLTMFGGSFAYILTLQGYAITFEHGLAMSQPILTLYNPPLAISLVILLTALFALYQYLSTRQKNWLIPLVVCSGLIAMFKVYAGMILLGGLLILTMVEVVKKRFVMLFALISIGVLFLATYWLFAHGAGYLILYPLWPSQKLLLSFPWYGYHEKIFTYTQQGVIRGIVETEAYGLFLFLIGGLGTRIIGLLFLPILYFKKHKLPSLFTLTVLIMTVISIVTPLFFIQSGKVFEIIQMTHYYVFFISLFAAFGLSAFFALQFNKFLKIAIAVIIIVTTLPTTIAALSQYPVVVGSARSLSSSYFQTLNFLSQQENYNATVLEIPPNHILPTDEGVVNWYKVSPSEVMGFSNKRNYISNQFIEFPGVDTSSRLQFLKKVLIFSKTSATDSSYASLKKEVEAELNKNDIRYIYSPYEILPLTRLAGVKRIYKNGNYVVYKIEK